MKIRSICEIAALSAISLCLASYAQTINNTKSSTPQPSRAGASAPFLHIEPSVPPAKNSQNSTNERCLGPEANSIDWGPYMAAMQRKIKESWFPPPQTERALNHGPVAVFKINKDGSISNLHLEHGCGAEEDKAALEAVEKAVPFEPLPQGSKDYIDIQYTFQSCPIFSGKSSGLFRRF